MMLVKSVARRWRIRLLDMESGATRAVRNVPPLLIGDAVLGTCATPRDVPRNAAKVVFSAQSMESRRRLRTSLFCLHRLHHTFHNINRNYKHDFCQSCFDIFSSGFISCLYKDEWRFKVVARGGTFIYSAIHIYNKQHAMIYRFNSFVQTTNKFF